jgi:hypothetical protein
MKRCLPLTLPRVMFSIAVYLAASSGRLDAQVATGNIRGVVADSTEAVIPNAKVILTNSGTGLQRTVITNESGDFNAPFMPLVIIRSPPRLPDSRGRCLWESICRSIRPRPYELCWSPERPHSRSK